MHKIVFVYALVAATCFAHGQDTECRTPDGGIGLCKPITSCPDLLAKAYSIKYNTAPAHLISSISNEIKQKKCGDSTIWKVCCSDCQTPDRKSGLVKYIRYCPHLWKLLNERTNLLYVRDSRMNPRNLDVCCGPSSDASPPPSSVECENMQTELPPDPNSKCCGMDVHVGSRIAGGHTTEIDEYPWTVLLEYQHNGRLVLGCGGSLISNRYVITAAHCILSNEAGLPNSVRVGEFDTMNTGRDFKILADGNKQYTDGATTVPIEAYLIHPQYNERSAFNDIAIIRLRTAVRYTEFVRPICLPTSDWSVGTSGGDEPLTLVVVGWGKMNENTIMSRYKQSLQVSLVNRQACQNAYTYSQWDGPYPTLWERQICAGGEAGKDSCDGDSGGPLMTEVNAYEPRFELVGVVSYGPKVCGTAGVPGVYTHVYKYVDWIQQSVRTRTGDWRYLN